MVCFVTPLLLEPLHLHTLFYSLQRDDTAKDQTINNLLSCFACFLLPYSFSVCHFYTKFSTAPALNSDLLHKAQPVQKQHPYSIHHPVASVLIQCPTTFWDKPFLLALLLPQLLCSTSGFGLAFD